MQLCQGLTVGLLLLAATLVLAMATQAMTMVLRMVTTLVSAFETLCHAAHACDALYHVVSSNKAWDKLGAQLLYTAINLILASLLCDFRPEAIQAILEQRHTMGLTLQGITAHAALVSDVTIPLQLCNRHTNLSHLPSPCLL